MLRRKMSAEMYKRFRLIKGLINKSVIENDCFGLRDPMPALRGLSESHSTNTLTANEALPPRAFAGFTTSDQKIEDFQKWLEDEMAKPDAPLGVVQGSSGGAVRWTDQYIESSYKKGMIRAETELEIAGIGEVSDGPFQSPFNAPIHMDTVANLYTRTWDGVKSVTRRTETAITRVLSQGLIDGDNPKKIARAMNKAVGLEIKRARTLARTEIVRAHHVATINTYEQAGAEGVTVLAEFATALDDRVCSQCMELEGQIFSLKEARGLIPVHPNCRCVCLPAKPDAVPSVPITDEVAFGTGTVTESSNLGGGVNDAQLVRLKKGDKKVTGVLKKESGEYKHPALLENPEFTAAQRERAAYLFDQEIGLNKVPRTVYRRGLKDYGNVSIQQYLDDYVPAADAAANGKLPWDFVDNLIDSKQGADTFVFDYLTGAGDRHSYNWMVSTKGKESVLKLIDNGYCFSSNLIKAHMRSDFLATLPDDFEYMRSRWLKTLQDLDVEKFFNGPEMSKLGVNEVTKNTLEARRQLLVRALQDEDGYDAFRLYSSGFDSTVPERIKPVFEEFRVIVESFEKGTIL
jgi:SPP1 gp7 family putative phage head morphogenesis protein